MDDYEHLNESHGNDLKNITAGNFEPCDLSNCDYSDRKYRVNGNQISETDISDIDLCFYIDIMDSIHFHLFHLYDICIKYVINILSVYVISTTFDIYNDEYS